MLAAVLMLTASLEGEVEVISGPTISFDWKLNGLATLPEVSDRPARSLASSISNS